MIEILESPMDFKNALLEKIKNARSDVYLNSLYIGSHEYSEILQNSKQQLKIGLDYYRGNRNLLERDSRAEFFYFKSPNYQALSKVLPRRWNETLGTFHVKGFIIDNDVILSGANLSTDYFTNRQDRYIVFNDNPELAHIYRKMFDSFHKISYSIDSQGNFVKPLYDYQELVKDANEFSNFADQEFIFKQLDKESTFVIPTIQLGSLGIKQEEKVLSWILQMLGEQGRKGYLSSAYLNIPSQLLKVINLSGIKLDVLTSSPMANGFYGANNVSKYLPDAYSCLEKELLQNSSNISLHEYYRHGWTFHAKGFWAKFKYNSQDWTVTTIGSSNFNSRSLNTDLESQAFLFTKDIKLSQKIEENRLKLFSWSNQVTISDINSRNIKPLVKLASKVLKKWL